MNNIRLLKAISKRANYKGEVYVEDYGVSLHTTARLPIDTAIDIINDFELLGWIKTTRTSAGIPIKLKLLVRPQECEIIVANVRQSLLSTLQQLI